MKYALIIIEIPEDKWREDIVVVTNFAKIFLDSLTPTEKDADCIMLSPSAILLPLSGGLHCLKKAVACAKDLCLKSRTLFFDQEPSWVITP